MKIRAFSLILISALFFSIDSGLLNASPQKEKKKKMKKSEMRDLISEYEEEIENLKKKVGQLEEENEGLDQELADAKLRSAELEAQMQDLLAKARPYLSDRMPTELYFKVQMGAYKKLDIQESFQKAKTLQTEMGSDGVKKYVVGAFENLDAAKKFESDLKKLGITDAWLVPYKNDRRISDEEASEIAGRDIRQ